MTLRRRAAKQKLLPTPDRNPFLDQSPVAGQVRQPDLQPVGSKRKVINNQCHAVNLSAFCVSRGYRTLVCGQIHQGVDQTDDVDATKSIFLRLMKDGARESLNCLIRNVVHSNSRSASSVKPFCRFDNECSAAVRAICHFTEYMAR